MSNKLLPLSLYIHFPWCVRKCPYCDFNSCAQPSVLPEEAYINALIADLDQELSNVCGRKLVSIFIGGGTPSLFSPKSIENLLDEIEKRITWESDIEITMEANPTTVEQEKFTDFRAVGINRLSIGVQSFQDEKLKILSRTHISNEASRAIEKAFQAGFSNVNLDLMYGLPKQSVDDALYDLKTAFEYSPKHLSWYQLTVEPQTVFAKNPPLLPEEDRICSIQEEGYQLIEKQGFRRYEISAYAQPNFQCWHNLNYWQFGDYLGIGAGAHSKITNESFEIMRYEKVKNTKDYLACKGNGAACRAATIIQDKDLPLEFMMNALRLIEGVPKMLFEERTGMKLTQIESMLKKAEDEGFLEQSPDVLRTTGLGRCFLNQCLGNFLSETL